MLCRLLIAGSYSAPKKCTFGCLGGKIRRAEQARMYLSLCSTFPVLCFNLKLGKTRRAFQAISNFRGFSPAGGKLSHQQSWKCSRNEYHCVSSRLTMELAN
eukprot:Gb_10285 [translate_table: standard]